MPILASEYNLRQSCSSSQKLVHHKRNKIGKNEGFLKKSLVHAAWFLQKMALKSEQKEKEKEILNLETKYFYNFFKKDFLVSNTL